MSFVLVILFMFVSFGSSVTAINNLDAKSNFSDSDMSALLTDSGDVYAIPEGIADITTDKYHPWRCGEDGILYSGNSFCPVAEGSSADKNSKTVSVLKVTVTGSGLLSFDYKLSSSDSYGGDLLLIWENILENEYDAFKSLGSKKEEQKNNILFRKTGMIDWTPHGFRINVGENESAVVFFAYRKNGMDVAGDDKAFIRNLAFYSGDTAEINVTVNDPSLGSVLGDTTYEIGETAELVAVPKDGGKFYGWNINGTFVSSEPVYSFLAHSNMNITAIFGNPDKAVARNKQTGFVYDSVSDSLKKASPGETVMLLADAVLDEKTEIPPNITLYIPYSDEFDPDGCSDGTKDNSGAFSSQDNAFCTLRIKPFAELTVRGTLRLGGVIGHPSQEYQGHTSGAFGQIENYGSIKISDGGVLDCFGFINGTGKLTAMNGAAVYEPFVVFDFAGGTNTLGLYNSKKAPFTQYTMQNICCPFDIMYGSILFGRCNLFAGGSFNKTDAVIVGKDSFGLLTLKNGSVLHRTVDKSKHCRNYCPDIGRVTYSIDGGADFRSLTMIILGVEITTSGILFPMPYCYEYILNNGSYNILTDTVLLPGAEMTVGEDAELTVRDRFIVPDGLVQNALSGKRYPTSEILKESGFCTNGRFVVNGILRTDGKSPFGGIIQSEKKGAKIITEQTNGDVDVFETVVSLGAATEYGDNTTVFTSVGRICSDNGFAKLEPGKTYISAGAEKTSLGSFTIDSYTDGTSVGNIKVHENAEFVSDEMICGVFIDEENYFVAGDITGDRLTDETDLSALADHLAGKTDLPAEYCAAADINSDGYIDAIDLTLLHRLVYGG